MDRDLATYLSDVGISRKDARNSIRIYRTRIPAGDYITEYPIPIPPGSRYICIHVLDSWDSAAELYMVTGDPGDSASFSLNATTDYIYTGSFEDPPETVTMSTKWPRPLYGMFFKLASAQSLGSVAYNQASEVGIVVTFK